MSWLDTYIPSETDREISNFLSFYDAKKAAKAEVARHKYEAEMQAQAEAEAASEEPVEEVTPPTEEIPKPVANFLQNRQIAMQLPGAPQYTNGPRPMPKYTTDPNLKLDPDKALNAIFGNEGGKTGMRTRLKGKDGKQATATGRYQIVKNTREGIRKAHFSNMDASEFEREYSRNPEFEYAVARAHMVDLIKRYGQNAIGAWYSPKYVAEGRWNEVPGKDYGNKLTVGQYQENAMKKYKKHGGWLDKFEEGGETEEESKSAAPKGYTRRTKQQREAWNAMLNYAEEKGIAGKPDLDDRNKNMSLSFIQEWNKTHPDKAISPDEVQYFQYELRSINDGTFPQLVTTKPEYAEIWKERMYNDKYNSAFIQRKRSEADNWFGSLTSQQYYPQYEFVQGDKKINYGVDYDKYAEAIFQENQKQKLAVRKMGGYLKLRQ